MKTKHYSTFLTILAVLTVITITSNSFMAHNHREAPQLKLPAEADHSDIYVFHHEEQGPDSNKFVANSVPLLLPASGPNFYGFADDVAYEIIIDKDGDAVPDICSRWRLASLKLDKNTSSLSTTEQMDFQPVEQGDWQNDFGSLKNPEQNDFGVQVQLEENSSENNDQTNSGVTPRVDDVSDIFIVLFGGRDKDVVSDAASRFFTDPDLMQTNFFILTYNAYYGHLSEDAEAVSPLDLEGYEQMSIDGVRDSCEFSSQEGQCITEIAVANFIVADVNEDGSPDLVTDCYDQYECSDQDCFAYLGNIDGTLSEGQAVSCKTSIDPLSATEAIHYLMIQNSAEIDGEPFLVDQGGFDLVDVGNETTDGGNVVSLIPEGAAEDETSSSIQPSEVENIPNSVTGVYDRNIRQMITIRGRFGPSRSFGRNVQVSRLEFPLLEEAAGIGLQGEDKYIPTADDSGVKNVGDYNLDNISN